MHNPVADLVQATPSGGCTWQREGECAGPHQLLPGQRQGHPANSTTDAGSPSISATWSVYVMCQLLSVCVVCQLLDHSVCGVSPSWSVCVWWISYLVSVCVVCQLLDQWCVVCQLIGQCAYGMSHVIYLISVCGVSATWSVCVWHVIYLISVCVWCVSYLTSVCI